MRKTVKASYTVEASWVMSICIFIVFASLSTSMAMYKKAYLFLQETTVREIDAVPMFRRIALGKEIINIE